jgi:hypothetical protein
MNFLEFQGGVERIRALLVGMQFQDFSIQDKEFLLLFYANKSFILRLSLKTPPVFFLEDEKFKLEKKTEKVPLALFLSKHFLRKKVTDVKYLEEWGRKFEIHLKDEKQNPFLIEVILVPGFQNVGLFVNDDGKEKKIYWNKPRELAEFTSDSKAEVSEFRSLDIIREEWYADLNSSKKQSSEKNNSLVSEESWKIELRKKIKKKSEAIEKIKQQSVENEIVIERLYAIGEQLKYKPLSQLSADDQSWLNQTQSKTIDREQIFKKAKVLAAKKDGMNSRITVLIEEIKTLTRSLEQGPPRLKHKISIAGKEDVSTRKLEVGPMLSVYMGKNAKDNVQLLKNSQPWELWFHLKDYPSAYAITRKNKATPVEHADLIKMATWFAKECFKNHKEKAPTHIEVIYTECRFVKLLKGDKLGRVTHTNTKTLRVSTT